MSILVETFPSVAADGLCRNAFIGRVSDLDVATDRQSALERLRQHHESARIDLGFGSMPLITAEQVHGNHIAIVGESTASPVPETDALITNRPLVCLGIYVADCCAVYAVDPINGCIGLAHAGKKGTELGIVPAMIRKMESAYGAEPQHLIIQLSPCIRPPLYEIDFAAEIVRQCREAGVHEVVDCAKCTGSDLEHYYSYRVEKGQTGRMLALLALNRMAWEA